MMNSPKTFDGPRTWVVLFFLCLAFHFISSYFVNPQASLDAAYYHILAQRLNNGLGFTEPFIWQHLKPYTEITRPLDYWQPLGIILYAVCQKVFSQWGEILGNHIIWAALSVLVFRLAFRITEKSVVALLAYVIFGCGGKYGFYISTTDNVAFYALFGFFLLRSLMPLVQVEENDMKAIRSGAECGFLSGLMALTRVEGFFFLMLSFVTFLFRKRFRGAMLLLVVFFVTIAPWVVRNQVTFGIPWNSSPKALFLRDYDDMFEPSFDLSWNSYSRDGLSWILQHKTASLRKNIFEFFLLPNFLFLFIFWIMGLVILWKRGIWLFLFMVIFFWFLNGALFTTQSLKGTALHIFAAFLPHSTVVCAAGIDGFVFGIMSKFPEKVKYGFLLTIALWAIGFTFCAIKISNENYARELAPYEKILLKTKISPSEKIASNFPIHVYLFSGCPGVLIPPSGAFEADKLAKKYGCRYVLLDARGHNYSISSVTFPSWNLVASLPPLVLWSELPNPNPEK